LTAYGNRVQAWEDGLNLKRSLVALPSWLPPKK
jgi:hypothetical protein